MINPEIPPVSHGEAQQEASSPPPAGHLQGHRVRNGEPQDQPNEWLEEIRFLFESWESPGSQESPRRVITTGSEPLSPSLDRLQSDSPNQEDNFLSARSEFLPAPLPPPLVSRRVPPLTAVPPGPGTYIREEDGLQQSCVMAEDGTWKVTQKSQDGTTYEGAGETVFRGTELVAVVPHGRGVKILPNGMRLEGEWKNNQPTGQYRLTLPGSLPGSLPGTTYEVNLNRLGHPDGVALSSSGSPVLFRDGQLMSPSALLQPGVPMLYAGSKNSLGNPTGLGLLTIVDPATNTRSDLYGEWKNGELSSGVLMQGKTRYEGSLQNNHPQGSGQASITQPDGTSQQLAGWWNNGTLVYPRQRLDAFDGDYDGASDASGLPHGQGVLKRDNGVIILGDWNGGQLTFGEIQDTNGVYKGPLDPLTLLPDTSSQPDQIGELQDRDGSIYRGPFLQGTIQHPYSQQEGAHTTLRESLHPNGSFRGEVQTPLKASRGDLNARGNLLNGTSTVQGVTGDTIIETKDPFSLGSCEGIEHSRPSAAGAVLNRWESPSLRDARIAGHYLLDDLTSFCQASENNPQQDPQEAEILSTFRTKVGPLLQTILKNAVVDPQDPHYPLPLERIEPLQRSEPVLLFSGWKGHAVDYVFYQNQLFVCQRAGAGQWREGLPPHKSHPIECIPFLPDKLPELLLCLQNLANTPESEAHALVYGKGDESLRSRFGDPTRLPADDSDALQPTWSGPRRMQRVGNCVLFSAMTALLCAGQLLMQKEVPSAISPRAATQTIYKAFRSHQKQKVREALASLTREEVPGMPHKHWLVQPWVSADPFAEGREKRRALLEDSSTEEILGQGEIQQGKLQRGVLRMDGMEWEGSFHDNRLHGLGRKYDLRTFTISVGNFNQGRLSGPAIVLDPEQSSQVVTMFDEDTAAS